MLCDDDDDNSDENTNKKTAKKKKELAPTLLDKVRIIVKKLRAKKFIMELRNKGVKQKFPLD